MNIIDKLTEDEAIEANALCLEIINLINRSQTNGGVLVAALAGVMASMIESVPSKSRRAMMDSFDHTTRDIYVEILARNARAAAH